MKTGIVNLFFRATAVVLALVSGAVAGAPANAEVQPATEIAQLTQPLRFEANLGQFSVPAAFVARGAAYQLALSPAEMRFTLRKRGGLADRESLNFESRAVAFRSLVVSLPGANERAEICGDRESVGRANYFVGNDPEHWKRSVTTYERVRVRSIFPGIDLIHYGNEQHLEYDFIVAAGADAQLISLRFGGADRISVDAQGALNLTLGEEVLSQPKPIAYQNIGPNRVAVSVEYQLVSSDTVGFRLGAYDRSFPLVIDPVVSYSKYVFAGDASSDDHLAAVAVGVDGDVYFLGETLSTGLASAGAFQTNLAGALGGQGDVFVARMNNDLSVTRYITYLGGVGYEYGFGLAVDAAGNAYVTGTTASTNFPTVNAVRNQIAGGVTPGFTTPAPDCFIAKIDPTGSNLVFSTFYGGAGTGFNGFGTDVGYGIALDASTNIYVAGYTYSTNFPAVNSAVTNANGFEDGFLLKLDASGTNVVYAMQFGGANRDYVRDVAVDASGTPVLVGFTTSTNFPVTTNATQLYLNGQTNVTSVSDAFFARAASSIGSLQYATFLGGTNLDRAVRVATDAAGATYVVGWTQSGDFAPGATNLPSVLRTNVAATDVFVTKFNPSNDKVYSVVFGGTARDEGWDIAVDSAGRAFVTGLTESTNFPVKDVSGLLRSTNSGGVDVFLAELSSDGQALVFSGLMGGKSADVGYGVAVDSGGNAYFAGETVFGTFPTDASYDSVFTDVDPFCVKVISATSLSISAATSNQVIVAWTGYAAELKLQANTNLLSTNAWVTLTNTAVFTNGFHQVALPGTNSATFFRLIKP